MDFDEIIFRPRDVDLSRSPLRAGIAEETFVLGAFNPGLTRLPNGNLLLMVRIAEALRQPAREDHVAVLRWRLGRFQLDRHPKDMFDMRDPRELRIKAGPHRTIALTSLSWLLPIELSPDGTRIIAQHYERAIAPSAAFQEYGIEDPRISCIEGHYLMTVCSVGSNRLCTSLYLSKNGLDWTSQGVVLDHQNKDMAIFEGKVGGRFLALTRPAGEVYPLPPPDADFLPGPAIQLAQSPDSLHWKPLEAGGIRPRKNSASSMKVGGGAPPILTPQGWLVLYHGVEVGEVVGAYRTFWALLAGEDPARVLRLSDGDALLEPRPDLSPDLEADRYVRNIVFTTGIAACDEDYLAASGEDDLACRLTRIPKSVFA
jgi:predicted GH43/DUF377 family glycosyl hydrolase